MYVSQANRGLLLSLSSVLLLFAAPLATVWAQATPAADLDEMRALSEPDNDSGPAGIVPASRGFNASLGTSSQHDSSNGWSSILNPNVAFRLNRFFSMDAGVPVYTYISIDANIGTTAKPVYAYSPKKGVFGDTSLSFEGDARAWSIDYNGTFSLGLPSGNTDYGLGAGQVTYNFNNHFEKNVAMFTPDIEMGFGDTSSLVDQRILKSYIAVGPMAHFQAGGSVDLPMHMGEIEVERELAALAAKNRSGAQGQEKGDHLDQHRPGRRQRIHHLARHSPEPARHHVGLLQSQPARPRRRGRLLLYLPGEGPAAADRHRALKGREPQRRPAGTTVPGPPEASGRTQRRRPPGPERQAPAAQSPAAPCAGS